jgi:hypothetical protein
MCVRRFDFASCLHFFNWILKLFRQFGIFSYLYFVFVFHFINTKETTTFAVRNPGNGFGQVQQWDGA